MKEILKKISISNSSSISSISRNSWRHVGIGMTGIRLLAVIHAADAPPLRATGSPWTPATTPAPRPPLPIFPMPPPPRGNDSAVFAPANWKQPNNSVFFCSLQSIIFHLIIIFFQKKKNYAHWYLIIYSCLNLIFKLFTSSFIDWLI